ncbi:MAG: CheR family methyltransferase [Chlamydiota bacterium]|nr:CheR family methyltransferase [Chlamydiota bacterium]
MDCIILERFKNILSIRLGIKISYLNDDEWDSLLQERLTLNNCKDPSEYLDITLKTDEEIQAVIEHVVNTETWFYREKVAFSAIIKKIPVLSRPLEILDLACSSGEEPFSVLMEVAQQGLSLSSVEIDAVDVSMRALQRAKDGVYEKYSFRGHDFGYVEQYFDKVDHGLYAIREVLKNRVSFFQGNVVESDFTPPRDKYDVILCRNLLMYLHSDALEQVFTLFREHLREDGILIVSSSEGEITRRNGFESYFVEGFQVYYDTKAATERKPVLG